MLKLKVFDHNDYESRLAFNQELMTLVASEFIKEATALMVMLQNHLEAQDWHQFELVSHRLKGAALEVSGYRLCELIEAMKLHLSQSNSDLLVKSVQALVEELDALALSLQQEILL